MKATMSFTHHSSRTASANFFQSHICRNAALARLTLDWLTARRLRFLSCPFSSCFGKLLLPSTMFVVACVPDAELQCVAARARVS